MFFIDLPPSILEALGKINEFLNTPIGIGTFTIAGLGAIALPIVSKYFLSKTKEAKIARVQNKTANLFKKAYENQKQINVELMRRLERLENHDDIIIEALPNKKIKLLKDDILNRLEIKALDIDKDIMGVIVPEKATKTIKTALDEANTIINTFKDIANA